MSKVRLSIQKTKNNRDCDLSGRLKSLNAECRNCAPITPFECLSGCRVYLLKSELRHLWEAMENPNYLKELFNALKNKARLQVMQAIVNGTCSLGHLQEELKKAGHNSRQDYLNEECLPALMAVGLAARVRENYHATTLGNCLTQLFRDFTEFVNELPTHSECYEEALLQSLHVGPKTFENIEATYCTKKCFANPQTFELDWFDKNAGGKSLHILLQNNTGSKQRNFDNH